MPRGIRVCQIDYVEEALDAERRLRRGEKQFHCKECGLWHWKNKKCGLGPGVTTGKAIRLLRVFRDIAQKDLAKKVRISPCYLSLIESDKRSPTIKTLKRIADVFYVRPGVLLR